MDLTRTAFDYSIRIAELVKYLRSDDKDFPLSDDLLKCGVGAGMFTRETFEKQKAIDCICKADYLIEMAVAAGYLTKLQTERIRKNGQDLIAAIKEI